MNGVRCALVAMAIVALSLSSSPATAGSLEDVAEAEALIALENMLDGMLSRIYSRTDERAKQAIFKTEQAKETIKSCRSSTDWMETYDDHLWSFCLLRKPPYARVYGVLFAKFHEEEIQREIALQAGQVPGLEEALWERVREQLTR